MKGFILLCSVSMLSCFSAISSQPISLSTFSEMLLEMDTPVRPIVIYRPNLEEMQQTAPVAKAIFMEAFSTTYTEYHRHSNSVEPIEKWLCLRSDLTLHSWLNLVFDEEYQEYLAGSKHFLYLRDAQGALIGWLSHSPVSEKGEMYLSQCSLEAGFRNHKIATTAFEKFFKDKYFQQLFPHVKGIKLITRKINTIAQHLFTQAGFLMDETIDPAVYGDSYDDRYVGFRLPLEQ